MDFDKLFKISAMNRSMMPRSIWLPGTVEPHVHCRPEETGQMEMVVEECMREHAAIVDIPNVPGIKTVADLETRKHRIEFWSGPRYQLQVFMTPLINDHTDVEMVFEAHRRGLICGVKVFWQGVSNDYGNSISRSAAIKELLSSLGDKVVITLHAECRDDYQNKRIPIKDREFWCIENEVEMMLRINPAATYVIRHVSDYRTLQWIKEKRGRGFNIHAEIGVHYMLLIDDDLFTSDDGHAVLNCDCVHWPRPKDKRSRAAIQKAALSGEEWLHHGLDYAMHLYGPTEEKGVKINAKGQAVGGLNFLPRAAKSILIDFYLGHGKQELLAPMMSENAAKLYGIKLSDTQHEYVQEDWAVEEFSYGRVVADNDRTVRARNFLAGHTMHWKRAV